MFLGLLHGAPSWAPNRRWHEAMSWAFLPWASGTGPGGVRLEGISSAGSQFPHLHCRGHTQGAILQALSLCLRLEPGTPGPGRSGPRDWRTPRYFVALVGWGEHVRRTGPGPEGSWSRRRGVGVSGCGRRRPTRRGRSWPREPRICRGSEPRWGPGEAQNLEGPLPPEAN